MGLTAPRTLLELQGSMSRTQHGIIRKIFFFLHSIFHKISPPEWQQIAGLNHTKTS